MQFTVKYQLARCDSANRHLIFEKFFEKGWDSSKISPKPFQIESFRVPELLGTSLGQRWTSMGQTETRSRNLALFIDSNRTW
jgi:hypothetical protein